MKQLIFVAAAIISCGILQPDPASAQGKAKIPNYTLAENARPLVLFHSTFKWSEGTYNKLFYNWKKTNETILPAEYSSPKEALWQACMAAVMNGLESAGIRPGTMAAVDQRKALGNATYVQDVQAGMMAQGQAYYLIKIYVNQKEEDLLEKFDKNRMLTAEDLTYCGLSVSKSNTINRDSIYIPGKKGGDNLEELLGMMKKEISKMPPGYFLKQITEQELGENRKTTKEEKEKAVIRESLGHVNEEVDSYPKDLAGQPVLVVHNFYTNTGIKIQDNLMGIKLKKFEGHLQKHYKGAYKIVTKLEYPDTVRSGAYSYILVPMGDLVKKTTTKTTTYLGSGAQYKPDEVRSVSYITSENYYVVWEISSGKAYYGPEKQKIIESGVKNPEESLEVTLKSLAAFYGWE